MALSTYSGLKTAVADWLNRTDLTTAIVDCVTLAETDIRKDVRCQAMESLASGTMTGETLAFPTRFLEARRLTLAGSNQEYAVPALYQQYDDNGSVQPVYTIIGQNFYVLNAANGDAYSLLYWASFAALSADSDTNWILTNEPAIYLFAALKWAAIYIENNAAAMKYEAQYQGAVGRLMMREKQASVSGSQLQVRTATYE